MWGGGGGGREGGRGWGREWGGGGGEGIEGRGGGGGGGKGSEVGRGREGKPGGFRVIRKQHFEKKFPGESSTFPPPPPPPPPPTAIMGREGGGEEGKGEKVAGGREDFTRANTALYFFSFFPQLGETKQHLKEANTDRESLYKQTRSVSCSMGIGVDNGREGGGGGKW